MKNCPYCGTPNLDYNQVCENCKNPLPKMPTPPSQSMFNDECPKWLYALAVLFPLWGIIVGVGYLVQKKTEFGIKLILTAFIAQIVFTAISFISAISAPLSFLGTLGEILGSLS